jgi:ectoine hydroxylase-related dioxygenase (phytanoyl-CoA dioxygenase family)
MSAEAALREHGYCVVRGAAERSRVAALSRALDGRFARTPFAEGAFSGNGTKRFHSLLTRAPEVVPLVLDPAILRLAEAMLLPHCDAIRLNLTQAIEIHPGAPRQVPHRDQDMWAGPKGGIEYLVNVLWPLSPFRETNGATMVWPDSHHGANDAAPVSAEMEPGDALVFLGSTLHAGGANGTALPRRAIILSYCLGWLLPYENMWLTYPPEVARGFPPELARLIGYAQHRPNLNNVDGQCPSRLLAGGLPQYAGTVDNLLPGQAERIHAALAA